MPFLFEDVYDALQDVVCRIQGGAIPGGCDAAHLHNVLLRYNVHSEHLRDSVAAVAHILYNAIMPWLPVTLLLLRSIPGTINWNW